jgi:hypothetical protein
MAPRAGRRQWHDGRVKLGARVAIGAGFGAIVGTLGDRVHTYYGVLVYPHPLAWGEAWWVPLIMAGAGVALMLAPGGIRRRLGEPAGGSTLEVVTATLWFAAAYLASGLWKGWPIVLTVVFAATFLARALRWSGRARWWLAAGAAVGGPLTERLLVAGGLFHYVVPAPLLGVPLWLPALYLHAAGVGRALDRRWP